MSKAFCIHHECGAWFTNAESLNEVLNAIESGSPLRVWWFGPNGARYTEEMWFDPERLHAIRTESDDG